MELKHVFRLSLLTLTTLFLQAAQCQTYSVIHSFNGNDGSLPFAGISLHAGKIYGTTDFIGFGNAGTVYEISPSGSNWLTNVISQTGGDSRALFGPDGHLYSTSQGGVFELIPRPTLCKTARCFWNFNYVHVFTGRPDGQYPGFGDLIWDQQGNIFGTTQAGGENDTGAVYELTPSGNGYTEQVIYSFPFDLSAGAAPMGIVMDMTGNLFGTTQSGGLQNCYTDQDCGVVFELTYLPGLGWQEKVLHAFNGGSDGGQPLAGVILDSGGNLYGVTPVFGDGQAGTIFELSPSGDTWTYKVLYSFSGIQGCGPVRSLTMNAAGDLYGTSACTGPYQRGGVFKLTNTQNGWVYTSLYDFTGGADGGVPQSIVTIDADGTLYGTASSGGTLNSSCPHGCGTVWMIKP